MNNRGKTHYYAAWTDSGFLLGCDHEHQTVAEAVDCNAGHAGSYVVAVENGVERALNDEEEAEFQRTPRKRPTPAVLHYEVSGYAVMVRIRFADGWGWDTWMRFETYKQALEHARPSHKIVAFGSPEWHALRQSREPALPALPIPPVRMQPPQRDDETLVEYVTRLIPSPIDRRDVTDRETALPVASESARPTFAEFVLEWINDWEMKLLEKVYRLLVSATGVISTLRSRMHKTGSRD
jgi:hypothetical protein